ncbi:putative hydrolase [Clostridioides difficile CD196]|uniref:Hydrolase n=3 Tax=Clostridioides difficile TaxID=1496 RepID=A0A0H3N4D8_CLODC|nr:putative hydrolase [Clostridioides difficile CD196]
MGYKLIVTDMDGTLLGNNHKVTDENKTALQKVIKSGINVTLATGRAFDSAKCNVDFLKEDMPIIACNGSLIREQNGNIIYSNKIDTRTCLNILDVLDKYDIYYQCNSIDSMLYEKNRRTILCFTKKIEGREDRLSVFLGSETEVIVKDDLREEIFKKDILKFVIIEEKNPSILDEIRKELRKVQGIKITSSWPNNIEVMNEGVDKGNAVKILAEKMNIDREDIIAFGDNYNDIEMIKFAGLGVAMGNAEELIKQEADYVTDTNQDSGVAKAIYKFLELKESLSS